MSQLQAGREECFQLGRGDCSPTTEDRKENSEDKAYFHPVRLLCQYESGDAHLPMESRLSSSWQQEAVSPISVKNTERRPTKRKRTTLSPTVRQGGYQHSRMRAFIREFGYKTRKHLVSCRQSDICRWIPNDNRKDCRTFQVPPGSSNDYSRGEKPESYAPDIKLLSSTTSLTGAQKQPCVHFMLETSPGDNQEDVARHDVISNRDDRKLERLPPLAADDQCELSSDACQPLISRHAETNEYDRAVLLPARCETDKRERRYSNDGHDVDIIVQSTRLPMFPFDAYEKRCICSGPGDTGDDGLPPCVEQPQHVEIAEEDQSQNISLNESADLFPDESQQSPSTTGNGKPSSTASYSILSVQSISSASLHVSSATTGSPEEVRSNRETASPPCMTSGETGYPETTVARRTRNKHLEEMYENINTGNGKSNNETSKSKLTKMKTMFHIANNLSASAADRKTSVDKKKGNKIFATAHHHYIISDASKVQQE